MMLRTLSASRVRPPPASPRKLAIAALLAGLLATLPALPTRSGLSADQPAADIHRALSLDRQQLSDAVARQHARHLAERYRRPFDDVLRQVVAAHETGPRHGLPATLLLAMAEVESSMNPAARSRYGAVGLMQVVPRHHPKAVRAAGGPSRLLDGPVSIEVGAKVLAGYVAGSGNLDRGLHRYSGGATAYAARVRARMAVLDRMTEQTVAALLAPVPLDPRARLDPRTRRPVGAG